MHDAGKTTTEAQMRHLIHLSDLHVGKTAAEWHALERLLDHISSLKPAGIVISGDLVEHPADEAMARQVRVRLDQSHIPYVAVPGNHDVVHPGLPYTFEAEYGPPVRLTELSGANVLLFDSFDGLPVDERTAWDRQCLEATGCWGDGRVSAEQFALFEHCFANDLDRATGVRLAVVHHHLEDTGDDKVNPLRNAEEFCAWCVNHGVRHVFVGHLHQTAEPVLVHGVMRYRVGRSTKSPYPFGVFNLDTEQYELRHLPPER